MKGWPQNKPEANEQQRAVLFALRCIGSVKVPMSVHGFRSMARHPVMSRAGTGTPENCGLPMLHLTAQGTATLPNFCRNAGK
ncbi:hypothetical protein JWG39_06680 [Desulforhopalus vacuolatus]|uniref:hypothetical protein n=1 Tax=Desulforhopalus vacuolatus TaxID=40414 RepID=UPI001963DB60|nr:hypothetical protein [Desulforhopalus vacuolatus]MBM9519504.1 hypothetical protein [Desulforhopalus vacuolatus]